MPHHRTHHQQACARLLREGLPSRSGGKGGGGGGKYNPEVGELPTWTLNILNAWQLGEEDLELIRAVWELCLADSPCVLSGVKTPCKEWVGPGGAGPWERSEARTHTLNYGLYWWGGEDRVHIRTHALAWRLAGHPLPSLDPRTKSLTKRGKLTTVAISHQCNNRRCCNPYHLRLETHAENMAYREKSKRRAEMELAADLAHLRNTERDLPPLPLPPKLIAQENVEDFLAKWVGLEGMKKACKLDGVTE